MDERENGSQTDHRIALDARDWIVRLTSGHVSETDLQRFKTWRDCSPEHSRAFERERLFWRQLQALDGKSDAMPSYRAAQSIRRCAVGRRALLIGGGAAATAAVVTVAMPRLHNWWYADFMTSVGERAEIALPDGSVAILNTDSAIAVDFTPQLRLVELFKGEVEFRVRADKSALFRVSALGGNSDAIGTTYAVKVLDGVATVTVTEGLVRVSGGPGQMERVEVEAAQQTHYAANSRPSAVTEVDTDAELAWRTGRVIFEGRPFAGAVAELGRYVPERIVMAPGIDRAVPVSGIFSADEAFGAVQALAKTQGFTTRRVPGVLIVIS
ncbi:MAG: Fe2+-dicitrate sensor protein [Shinella sp. 65-6]|nr:MAG: Fe2+-dicitrate sensor protein [Shinella sp. 65-6]